MRRGNGIPRDLCSASRESGTGKLPERSKSRQGLRPYPSNAYELTANTLGPIDQTGPTLPVEKTRSQKRL